MRAIPISGHPSQHAFDSTHKHAAHIFITGGGQLAGHVDFVW
jgi:hypothetical protein